jgi:uncharacterized surface protein with fasciclin (FAS1) repeats
MTRYLIVAAVLAIAACDGESSSGGPGSATSAAAPPAAAAATAPQTVASSDTKTVWTVATGSPDHTTLVAAVKAADLVEVLASPGGVYTVFAPTNAAFDKLPKGTVEDLLKPEKKPDLRKILQHHVGIPVVAAKDMKEGGTLTMADGGHVTFHVKDGKVTVDGANILASIPTANGIVHVVDSVILPTSK